MTGLALTEPQLQSTVLDMARTYGVRTVHFRPARTADGGWRTPVQGDGKGWPDLVLVGPGGLLVRELKTDTGKLTPEQRQWLDVLRAAGVDADVWRPVDLRSGRITAELQALRRARQTA